MEKPLVSLLTPCYNTAQYIHRLLNSVLTQTYSNIEMFVIDDGSTDNSAEVIKSYIDKFQDKGYALHYIYQENSGQSVAIQNGLNYVSGKYLAWPDSDDFYATNDAIEKMVDELEKSSSEYAMVRTQEQLLDESTMSVVGINGQNVKHFEEQSLFEDCLFQQNGYYFCSGAYMVRIEALKNSCKWPMYMEKNAGQNWQLMLPVLWQYKCISINEILYSVLVRQASHSRGQYDGYVNSVLKFTIYRNTIIGTLNRIIGMDNYIKENYQKKISEKYNKILYELAVKYRKTTDCKKFYVQITNKTLVDKVSYFLVKLHFPTIICGIALKVMRKFKIVFNA